MKTLFINRQRILELTSLNGNVDFDKLRPHIYNAQILNLEPLLGSNLYQKLISYINLDSVGGDYKTLLEDYITPALVFYTMEHYVSFSNYEIANAGININAPTGTTNTPDGEIIRLVQRYRSIADKYAKKLSDYLCDNSSLFPELSESEDEIRKVEAKYRVGWSLGKSNLTAYEKETGQGY